MKCLYFIEWRDVASLLCSSDHWSIRFLAGDRSERHLHQSIERRGQIRRPVTAQWLNSTESVLKPEHDCFADAEGEKCNELQLHESQRTLKHIDRVWMRCSSGIQVFPCKGKRTRECRRIVCWFLIRSKIGSMFHPRGWTHLSTSLETILNQRKRLLLRCNIACPSTVFLVRDDCFCSSSRRISTDFCSTSATVTKVVRRMRLVIDEQKWMCADICSQERRTCWCTIQDLDFFFSSPTTKIKINEWWRRTDGKKRVLMDLSFDLDWAEETKENERKLVS